MGGRGGREGGGREEEGGGEREREEGEREECKCAETGTVCVCV